MAEYKLSYTAKEIDEKIGKVSKLTEDTESLFTNVGSLQTDVGVLNSDVSVLQTDIQTKAEVVTLTTAEYEELEANSNTNANALYMITDAEDEIIQSDWNQSDSSTSDYVKNRTHYTECQIGEFLPECTIDFSEGSEQPLPVDPPTLIAGESYTVTWNGTEHECVGQEFNLPQEDGSTVYVGVCLGDLGGIMGGDSTGEPFILVVVDPLMVEAMGMHSLVMAIDGSTSATISIEGMTEVVHKLDNKYLDLAWIPTAEKGTVCIEYQKLPVSDSTQRVEWVSEDIVNRIISGDIKNGDIFVVVFDGVRYECPLLIQGEGSEGTFFLGNVGLFVSDIPNIGEPFLILIKSRAIVYANYTVSHTIMVLYPEGSDVVYTTVVPDGLMPGDYVERDEVAGRNVSGKLMYVDGHEKTAGEYAEVFNSPGNIAVGDYSHAEGESTTASGSYSHAEGESTTASGFYSHAEGVSTIASGDYSHAEGYKTITSGNGSHAEGYETVTSGAHSHAEGVSTIASGAYSHAEGYKTIASGNGSHAEGYETIASDSYSHAEGQTTFAYGWSSHAEGSGRIVNVKLSGEALAVEYQVADSNEISKFLGGVVHCGNNFAKIVGVDIDSATIVVDVTLSNMALTDTNAKVYLAAASGDHSHAEGVNTIASGSASHAEGVATIASGDYSHAEGGQTTASGDRAHAEGGQTTASGDYSHVEGQDTVAGSNHQHVQGKHNIEDTEGKCAHIVGNGKASNYRSNAHTLDWDGNAWFSGDVYVGSTSGTNKDEGSKKLATEEYVNSIAIHSPSTATVGQTIVVSEVDENGKPTAWEAVDMPVLADPFVLTDENTGIKYKLTVVDGNLKINGIGQTLGVAKLGTMILGGE